MFEGGLDANFEAESTDAAPGEEPVSERVELLIMAGGGGVGGGEIGNDSERERRTRGRRA